MVNYPVLVIRREKLYWFSQNLSKHLICRNHSSLIKTLVVNLGFVI